MWTLPFLQPLTAAATPPSIGAVLPSFPHLMRGHAAPAYDYYPAGALAATPAFSFQGTFSYAVPLFRLVPSIQTFSWV